ncbi:MAG TPA: hypothetical protein VFM36_00955 [Thermoanaerobaculia bacterium]|nr:hypothetical protein [Thermoanaerobaculia bacterium]
MPRIELSSLPDDAQTWVFGISPALDERQAAHLLGAVDRFLADWAAHGSPIHAGRDLVEGSFLVIAVDKQAETSGCSIDRMFGTLRDLERQLGVTILDSARVFFRHGDGHADALSRPEFRANADMHTLVFDTTVSRLGEVRSGSWEKPAGDSWHRDLLKQTV